MIKLSNFKSYKPVEQYKSLSSLGISFLISEEGKDWYESQSDFAVDTLKVAYDPETKVIRSAAYDVSYLFPQGMSVAETTNPPKRFSVNGPFDEFIFNEEKNIIATRVYTTEEIKSSVDNKKSTLISEAISLISPLQFAIDLDMATEEERERLKSLQKYVVLLNRVPQQETYPTGVVWPDIPTT